MAWASSDHAISALDAYTEEMRPRIPSDCPPDFAALMERCWHEEAGTRPVIRDVVKALDAIAPSKGSMVDNLIYMLEKYSRDLEGIVAERTKELAVEKEKVG